MHLKSKSRQLPPKRLVDMAYSANHLGENLRHWLHLKDLQKDEFSEMLDYAPEYLRSCLYRTDWNPDLRTFVKILNLIGCKAEDLLRVNPHANNCKDGTNSSRD